MNTQEQINHFGVHITFNLILVNKKYRNACLIQGIEDLPTIIYTKSQLLDTIKQLYPKLKFFECNQGTIVTRKNISPNIIETINNDNKYLGLLLDYPCFANWNKDIAFTYKYGIHIYVKLNKSFYNQDKFQIIGNVCPDKATVKRFITLAKEYTKCFLQNETKDLLEYVYVYVEKL